MRRRRGIPPLFHTGRLSQHLRVGLLVGLLVFASVGAADWLGLFDWAELHTLDLRFVARFLWDRSDIDQGSIVVVSIDERSLAAIGPWPWPLDVQAQLVEALTGAGAEAIGLNYLIAAEPADAEALARLALAVDGGRVVLASASQGVSDLAPPDALAARASGVGTIDLVADGDGVVRRIDTRARPNRPQPFSFVVASSVDPGVAQGSPQGSVLINYRPPANAARLQVHRWMPTVSAVDVLAGLVDPHVSGRVALVGPTALSFQDRFNTPLAQSVPSVYIQAFAIRSWLTGDHIRPVVPWITWSVIASVALLGGVWAVTVRPWFLTLTMPLAAGLATAVVTWVFITRGAWFSLTPLLAVLIGEFVAGLVYAYSVVDRDTHRVRNLFRRYVAPEVVDRLLQDAGSLEAGRRAHITVLFADIRGFTAFAERVSPEEAVKTLNKCLEAMAEAVLTHGGMLDKYIGDAVMAVFGAPLARHDHAQAAVSAALEIRRRIDALAPELARRSGSPLRVGIGIHTGVAVVGSVGSQARREYTAIGDAVNVASRLEELAGPGEIIVSDSTRHAWGVPAPTGGVKVSVRGRRDPVQVFTLDEILAHAPRSVTHTLS